MSEFEFNNLKINHIGIIINSEDKNKFSEKFLYDPIQKVEVLFKFSQINNCFIEYITREGRAKNYELGFNHMCYNVENRKNLNKIHEYIITNNLGIRLTLPEKSISLNCNYVTFYKLKFFNNIEFNIKDYSD
tara:strand:+ start:12418 stop:12813 length:396 start_codon:yes stop_codon:yes gene_type:complete